MGYIINYTDGNISDMHSQPLNILASLTNIQKDLTFSVLLPSFLITDYFPDTITDTFCHSVFGQ